jgi:hypothetical protein
MEPPDFRDLLLAQARPAVPRSHRRPALGPHVGAVLGVRAEEEMVRITAPAVVALMANLGAIGHRTNEQLVGETVGSDVGARARPAE